MAQFRVIILLGQLLFCWHSSGYCQSEINSTFNEIQVLIDVSGSMKQNDPHNLRIDATKLLVSLLPDDAAASLWLFAEKTTLLTQSKQIDTNWKQQAVTATDKIHSRGVYTHIEDAIDSALRHGFAGNGDKYLILLTDGMVDISKDIMVSADSRERILSEWIPKLQQRQIKVQTIALSDQADKELLEKLAFETGGWMETAQSAERLQRAFLKTAQKTAPKDTLPLDNNRFHVDDSVKEFSLVVFKVSQTTPTQLVAPDGNGIDKHASTVSWLEGAGYDLITVKQPQAGDWRVDAAVDPDNRVMILTDLKLRMDEMPNIIGDKQTIPLRAYVTERDQLLDRTEFLKLIDLSLSIDQQTPMPMKPSPDDTGYFIGTLPEMAPGKHRLTLTADGKTFIRELQHEIEVLAAPIRVEKLADSQKRMVTLKFHPDTAVLDTSVLVITAMVNQLGHEPASHVVENKDGVWELTLDAVAPGSSTEISFNIMAKTLDGKVISPTLAPIIITDTTFQTEDHPGQHHEQEVHPKPSPSEPISHESVDPETPTDTTSSSGIPWGIVIAIVIAVNLLTAGIGFLIHKALKKANAARRQQLMERLS